jgi:hypothetical protein
MAKSLSEYSSAPMLITPECDTPGCSIAGDQYTMVRCRRCGGWFCPEHIDAAAGARLVRPGRLGSSALRDLAYYQGICVPCHQAHESVH